MDKMRQFSFQDHVTSKHSDVTLDSLNSILSSCNNGNFGQELQDSKGVNSKENSLNRQSPRKDSKISPKNTLSIRQQLEEKENINSELTKENIFLSNHTMMSEFSRENLDDTKALLQEKWKNDFKENENHLRENWKKINKINKLLAEHKKKKSNKLSRNPLSQVDENGALKEIDQNIPQSSIIKDKKYKGAGKNCAFGGEKNQNKQDIEPFEAYDESYSYEYFNERPEQIFSAALVEPFSPAITQHLVSSKSNDGLQHQKKQNSSSQNSRNSRVGEDTPELGSKIKNKIKEKESKDSDVEMLVSHSAQTEVKSTNKASDKKIPIEERLRLKQIEREIKITCLREERNRNLMKEMKDKPQISENSLKIAKQSRRARENEQVMDRLSVPESKKALLLGTPKCTEPSEYQNQSKISYGAITQSRNTHEEKSFGGEMDSNINLYKKSDLQASITGTYHTINHFEKHRAGADDPNQSDSQRNSESSQQNHPSKSLKDSVEPIDFLQGYPSDNSLQKQASDRLIQAIAKKGISQSSGISPLSVKPENFYKSESSVPLSPMSIYPPSGADKKKEMQDSFRENIDYEQDIPAYESIHTDQGSITSLKTPKHIYLSIPKDMIEGHIPKMDHQEKSRNLPDQNFVPVDLYDNEENYDAAQKTSKKENIEQMHNSDYYGEVKKRSTRQPTFGCSPAKKGTNHSSKLASHDMPAEMVTGGFNQKNSHKQIDNINFEHDTAATSRISIGKPSNESLMNSLKLREQKFGLFLSDKNQVLRKNLTLGDEKPWPDIDVYMRNSMWLSAKNSKVAAMNSIKENQEMKECTFHPHLTEKYNSSKSMFKSATKMISERGQDRAREIARQKRGVSSYKDLYNHKLRTFDQQQTNSITSPSNHIEKDYARENEIEEEISANMGQQEEQKFI